MSAEIAKMASTSGTGNVWPVAKFMKFENFIWTEMNMPNLSLKICYDLLIVTSNDFILLNLSLNKQLKGYFKDKTMIFAYLEKGILQKAKLELTCSTDNVETIASIISIYTPVHNLNESNEPVNNNQHSLQEEIVEQAKSIDYNSIFPPEFPMNEFLKSCILDPAFPTLLEEVEKTLQQYL